MDVADWLRGLGLGQYEAAFHENSVTIDLLPTLTVGDLEDLGVTAVGHRRRMLNAIAALNSGAQPAGDQKVDALAPNAAERRQLSVMFCDISGSTALSTRLDPEDLSALVRTYQATVRAAILPFGGFIARYVGDGVLIYFGWPEAHETDAERAVRAAIAVIAAIGQSPIRGERVGIRIGIATGLVVVGAPIGDGDARQQTAIGETPNLAARLQGLAGIDGIAIDETTRRQLGDLFDYQDLGKLELKGFPYPVRAWLVLDERSVQSRFEALHAGSLAPMVGRDDELDVLLRRWRQAKMGEGQVVLLCGEPGIGKSRLLAALQERIGTDRYVRLQYFCSPHHQDSVLHPIISGWRHQVGFAPSDSDTDRLRKLEAFLQSSPAEDVALIADLLGVATDVRYPKLEFSPQLKRARAFSAVTRWLASRAYKNSHC